MKLYIKEHVFTWNDKFSIYSEDGSEKFYAVGEVFTFGKKIHLYDSSMTEIAFVSERVNFGLPKFELFYGNGKNALLIQHFSFLRQRLSVNGPEWQVEGNLFTHDFCITKKQDNSYIAVVAKDWFSFGDAYSIDIIDESDDNVALVLSVILSIDAIIDRAEH